MEESVLTHTRVVSIYNLAFIYNKKRSLTILHMCLFTKENNLLKSRHKYVSSISKKIIQKLFDYIDVMIFSSQAKIFAYISSLINNYFKARWGRSVKNKCDGECLTCIYFHFNRKHAPSHVLFYNFSS